MVDRPDQKQIEAFDAALRKHELESQTETLEYASVLADYAHYLKSHNVRLLDAANMLARSQAIRDRFPSPPIKVATSNSSQKLRTNPEIIKDHVKEWQRAHPKQSNVMIGAAIIGGGLVIAQLVNYPNERIENAVLALLIHGKITGAAWVTRGGGQSDLLRGLEIDLCKEALKDEIEQIYHRPLDTTLHGYTDLSDALPYMSQAAAQNAVQVTKTDVDAKFVIPDVPHGNYYLYAAYPTNFSAAYWLIPVKVNYPGEIKINLDNSNMAAVYNKSF